MEYRKQLAADCFRRAREYKALGMTECARIYIARAFALLSGSAK